MLRRLCDWLFGDGYGRPQYHFDGASLPTLFKDVTSTPVVVGPRHLAPKVQP